jgi:hypothetical protein
MSQQKIASLPQDILRNHQLNNKKTPLRSGALLLTGKNR